MLQRVKSEHPKIGQAALGLLLDSDGLQGPKGTMLLYSMGDTGATDEHRSLQKGLSRTLAALIPIRILMQPSYKWI